MEYVDGVNLRQLEWLPKLVSETVGQTCPFDRNRGSDSLPFRKFILANSLLDTGRVTARGGVAKAANIGESHVLTLACHEQSANPKWRERRGSNP